LELELKTPEFENVSISKKENRVISKRSVFAREENENVLVSAYI